ncbi:MAG: Tol-Pal system beta propeller repeat protein TolB [Candidatus Zixiibacteriota bacterium]
MIKQKILIIIFCFLLSLFSFKALFAQTEIYVKMPVGGAEPLDIAVTDFSPKKKGFSAEEKKISYQVPQIIREDLDFSLLFYVAEIDSFTKEVVGDNPLNLEGWYKLGVQMVLAGELELRGEEILAEVFLYEVIKGKKVYSKSYKTSSDNYRGLAHTISDDLVLELTGEKGIFNTRIAFVSTRSGNKEIYISDYDGFNIKKVTEDKSINLSPHWSPNGKKLIYTSYKKGNPDLWIRDLQAGTNQILSSQAGLNSAPAWSPDGKNIGLTLSKDGNPEIYLIDQSGKIIRRLTNSSAIESSPSFSPNGKEIVFTSDRTGSPQIYIMDIQGSNIRRLTYDLDYCDSPAWSPKGDKIAFVVRTSSGFDIYTIDVTGENLRRLTYGGNNENPSWSPDGYHLVFSSNRTGKYEIYTMSWDGSNQKIITSGGGNYNPSWSFRY